MRIMQESTERTKKNTGMVVVNFAMNYGGRAEITQAIRNCIREFTNTSQITEEIFETYLFTNII